jgi:prepilin-type N-terminal cleavage/methylation domain-containing protein
MEQWGVAMMNREDIKFSKYNRCHRLYQPVARGLIPKVQGGFGLLELLIAITILAIGMLGIMKLQMQSGFGNAASRHNSAAVNLARSKMEELKRIGAYSIQGGAIASLADTDTTNDLGDWSSPDFTEGPLNESAEASIGGKIFTRSWNVVHDFPITDFKTIRIRVSWAAQGVDKHVDMETQIGLKDMVHFE